MGSIHTCTCYKAKRLQHSPLSERYKYVSPLSILILTMSFMILISLPISKCIHNKFISALTGARYLFNSHFSFSKRSPHRFRCWTWNPFWLVQQKMRLKTSFFNEKNARAFELEILLFSCDVCFCFSLFVVNWLQTIYRLLAESSLMPSYIYPETVSHSSNEIEQLQNGNQTRKKYTPTTTTSTVIMYHQTECVCVWYCAASRTHGMGWCESRRSSNCIYKIDGSQ